MRNILIAAIATLPLMSGVAFAGNEQPYQGSAMPVIGAPAATETNTQAYLQPGPAVTRSLSRVATTETGNERPADFGGMAASDGGIALASN